MKTQTHNVYDAESHCISGMDGTNCSTRQEFEEAYAKGCGWESAEQMRKHYPIWTYTFVLRSED